jgi:hypothetical protein
VAGEAAEVVAGEAADARPEARELGLPSVEQEDCGDQLNWSGRTERSMRFSAKQRTRTELFEPAHNLLHRRDQ